MPFDPNSRRQMDLDRIWEKTVEEIEEIAPCFCHRIAARKGLKFVSSLKLSEQCVVCKFAGHVFDLRVEAADEDVSQFDTPQERDEFYR
jgi:hypothetical protein